MGTGWVQITRVISPTATCMECRQGMWVMESFDVATEFYISIEKRTTQDSQADDTVTMHALAFTFA